MQGLHLHPRPALARAVAEQHSPEEPMVSMTLSLAQYVNNNVNVRHNSHDMGQSILTAAISFIDAWKRCIHDVRLSRVGDEEDLTWWDSWLWMLLASEAESELPPQQEAVGT